MAICLNKTPIYFLGIILSIVCCSNPAHAQIQDNRSRFDGHPPNPNLIPGAEKDLLPDDPLVQEPTPPPEDAPLTTKLGWCEVQVYGHTFSDAGLATTSLVMRHRHLPERLKQLCVKIHFEPEKSGTKLMGDIDALVKYVDAHYNTAALNGASAQAPATPTK